MNCVSQHRCGDSRDRGDRVRRHPAGLIAFSLALFSACSGGAPLDGNSGGSGNNPPTGGVVYDGLGADIDTQTSTTTISANWHGFEDAEGPIAGYDWAIGTTPGGTEVMGWTPVATATSATRSGLSLTVGTTYYCAVRAADLNSNLSQPAVSDGVTVVSSPPPPPPPPPGQTLASQLTQWGITWTFDRQYEVGQFCNGDWWVVGPLTVVQIDPPSAVQSGRTINGSMINPVPNGLQGYDSQVGDFRSNLNRAMGVSAQNPLAVAVNSSLISTISQIGAASNGSQAQLRTAAVLTVLPAAPPVGSFRPPYAGSDKTIRFHENQLDYGRLARLTPVAGVPTIGSIAAKFQRVWLDHKPGWSGRLMHPVENMWDYGRDLCADVSSGALMLNLDLPDTQKRDLYVRMVQLGIDNWGNILGGCTYGGDGGHGSGRKFPILLAGAALNDAAMLGVGQSHRSGYYGPSDPRNRNIFGEDAQTFVVEQTASGVYNWGHGGYSTGHVGLPEWGFRHSETPSQDDVTWNNNYRQCCTANAWSGQLLAARVMGLRAAWNHQVLFDYQDRFMTTEPPGWMRSWVTWHATMWDTHRSRF